MRTCCFVLVLFLTFLCFSNFYTEATQQILFHEVTVETGSVTLKCDLSVGAAVKWSRDSNGGREDILTYAQGKTSKHIPDASKRYHAYVDGALYILKVKMSDSGLYYCNDTPVVNLTVASENTSVTLRCPQSVGSTIGWRRRDSEGRDEDIRDTDSTTADAHRPYVSLETNSLVIRSMAASSSGTYHCYGVKGRTTEPRKPAPPHSTTTGPTEPLTTSRDKEPAIPQTTTRTAERTTPTQLPASAPAPLMSWSRLLCSVVVSSPYLLTTIILLAYCRDKNGEANPKRVRRNQEVSSDQVICIQMT